MEPQETGMSDFITAAQPRRVNNGNFNSSLDTEGSNHGIMGRRFPDGGLLRHRK